MTDKVQKIREEVEKIKTVHSSVGLKESNPDILVVQVCTNLLSFIDSLQKETVSEDLEKAAKDYSNNLDNIYGSIGEQTRNAFKDGAKWQFERVNETLLSEVLPCFMRGGEADEVVAKLDEVLSKKK